MNVTNRKTTASKADLHRKHELVYEQERILANRIAQNLIETPQLHIWMILIPVIFVFHFFSLSKVSKGRKAFVHNYLVTRRKTMEEVHASLEEGRKPDIERLAESEDVPQAIRHHYKAWLEVLVAHYTALFKARGASIEELVKSAYGNRNRYRQALGRLNDAEMRFNSALRPLLPNDPKAAEAADDAERVIAIMQQTAVRLRKEQAASIFA